MLDNAPFKIDILPSAIVDIVQMRVFYDGIESGLGAVFKEHIIEEIDKLETSAGIDEMREGYYFRHEKRFHQGIYYKLDDRKVIVWRVLDTRFNPKRIREALTNI